MQCNIFSADEATRTRLGALLDQLQLHEQRFYPSLFEFDPSIDRDAFFTIIDVEHGPTLTANQIIDLARRTILILIESPSLYPILQQCRPLPPITLISAQPTLVTLREAFISAIIQFCRTPATTTKEQAEALQAWERLLQRLHERHGEMRSIFAASPAEIKNLLRAKMTKKGKSPLAAERGRKQAVPTHFFPLERAIIIDPDEQIRPFATQVLTRKATLEVDFNAQLADAWKQLHNKAYNLILLSTDYSGWREYMLDLRRSWLYRNTPILLLTSTPAHDISEKNFGVVKCIPKPLNDENFGQAIEELAIQSCLYREYAISAFELLQRHGAALQIARTDIAPTISLELAQGYEAAGDLAMQREMPELAEIAYLTAVRQAAMPTPIANSLARLYIERQQFLKATAVLMLGHMFAPQHPENLSLLGEIALYTSAFEESDRYFQAATQHGGKHARILAGQKLALGLQRFYQDQPLNPVIGIEKTPFLSYLTPLTAHLIRTHGAEQALPYFEAATFFVQRRQDLAKLKYNCGFCYYSMQKKQLALPLFLEALELANGDLPQATKYVQLCGTND